MANQNQNNEIEDIQVKIEPPEQKAAEPRTVSNIILTSKIAREKTVENLRRLDTLNENLLT